MLLKTFKKMSWKDRFAVLLAFVVFVVAVLSQNVAAIFLGWLTLFYAGMMFWHYYKFR